jgi:CheY-like chemotaxis protein
MDGILKYAREIAQKLEEEYGQQGTKPLVVDAAREGDVYELDPFAFAKGEDVEVEDGNKSALEAEAPIEENGSASSELPKQSVLLGFSQTKAEPICKVLQNSENAFDVEVLSDSDTALTFIRDQQPAVVILDEELSGSKNGFAACEEIRTKMGEWGEQVLLMIIAADGHDTKKQKIADRLNLVDYIQGPFSPSYLLTRIQVSLLRMPLRWRRAPISSDEPQRLAVLQSTGLLDTGPEERFDRITRLASLMFRTPMSLVSLVDRDRQWFKSNVGLPDAKETPRDWAFCSHAILEDEIMVVSDALQDARFADNPLVEGDPKIRFYAGCPLMVPSKDGNGTRMAIGTLCILDSKPRDLGKEEMQALKDFGAMVEREVMSEAG